VKRRLTAPAFTLIELLVVIAIISVLAAIILPVMGKVRGNARRTVCSSNMRQIAQAISLYASDNDNRFPDTDPRCYSVNWDGEVACDPWAGGCSAPATSALRYEACWQKSVFPYVKDNDLYVCPSAKALRPDSSQTGYALNGAYWFGARKGYVGHVGTAFKFKYAGDTPMPDMATAFDGYIRTSKVPDPSGTLMVMDSSPAGNYQVGESPSSSGTGQEHPSDLAATAAASASAPENDSVPDFSRHGSNGINALFADGHAKWVLKDFVYEKSTLLDSSGNPRRMYPNNPNAPSAATWQVDRHWTMEQD